MPTNTPPTITNLTFPKVVDLSNGAQQVTFVGTAQDNSGGAGIKKVTIFFDKSLDSTNGFSSSMFSLGYFSGVGTLGSGFNFSDSFSDSTPNTANSFVNLATSNSPGIYTITEIDIIDLEGNLNTYSNAQLVALGISTTFSIVNEHAPSSPTLTVVTDSHNYVSGNTPVITGTAVPGASVNVTGILFQAFGKTNNLVDLGTVKADSNGNWRLQTAALEDGNYHDVRARSIDSSGVGSAPSSVVNFNVKVHLPEIPLISVSKDINNHVIGTHPEIFGTSEAGSTITVYDGGKILGTTIVDSSGRWGFIPPNLADGDHIVTAIVTDGAGRASPSSIPLNFNVNSKVPLGFTFSITSVTDTSGSQHDLPGFQLMLQRALDEVGARFSAVLDGQEDIPVRLIIEAPRGSVVASAGGSWVDAVQTKGNPIPPIVGPATLHLPVESTAKPDLSFESLPLYVSLLAHEMLHVMGFDGLDKRPDGSTLPPQPFLSFIKTVGDKMYFSGPNATALNGGLVPLADLAHLLDPNDIINPHGADIGSQYLSPNNPIAPFSNMDIAVLKDIGFTNKYTLVSNDGHTFIPGNGLPGNNLVNGTNGTDTVFYNAPSSHFSIVRVKDIYNVTDNVGNGGTEILSKIEKIQFNDKFVTLNTLPIGTVAIQGELTQGQTLTANSTLIDPDGLGMITYQWQSGGGNIQGATNSTYTLTQAEIGKPITLIASYTDGNGTFESVSSLSKSKVGGIFVGTTGNDMMVGSLGNDMFDGGLGFNTVSYSSKLSDYTVNRVGNKFVVQDKTGADGTDTLSNIENLKFTDMSLNLTVQGIVASAPASNVQRLMELYIAFFNRVPDADGLEYWIGQMKSGQNIEQIAKTFYNAGIQFPELTHMTETMSNADFINLIYRNVLGRTDGADQSGLDYWSAKLADGTATRGTLVSTILDSAHTFKGDATWGWVANLLDNKIAVARTFAIDLGLNYLTPTESISHGMAIAAAVTPTDINAALTLIGISVQDLHLL